MIDRFTASHHPMLKVLVVEDYELNVRLIEDLLNFSGYQPLIAYTAEEGLQLARQLQPDLILMDMRLGGGGMDGWTAARIMKSDGDIAHIPLIALAAPVWDGERESALEAGCDEYISKPFDIRELRQKIDYHLGVGTSS